MRNILILVPTLALLVAPPRAAAAQQATDDAAAAEERAETGANAQDVANRFDFFVIGGLTPDSEELHASAGGLVRLSTGTWGVVVLGMAGRGGDYDSFLAGTGLSRTVYGGDGWSAAAFLGGGYYREVGWTEIERSAGGVLVGGLVTMRAGPLNLGLMVSDLIGRYDGTDVLESFTFQVPRIAIGVGL